MKHVTLGEWLLRHRRSLLFLLALLVLGGAFTALRLPVALFPQITFPRIVVSADSGNMPIAETQTALTLPLEQALRGVPGVEKIRATTSRGAAEISVQFAWGAPMNEALLQAEAAINQTLPKLPPDTTYHAQRMDPTVFPVLGISLTSKDLDPVALRHWAYYSLRPRLLALKGVAGVDVQGGEQREYQVVVDPMRLQAYGLTPSDVEKALAEGNVITAVGRLQRHYRLYQVLSESPVRSRQAIAAIILKSGPNGVVNIGDVARVEASTVPQWTTVTANGKNAVLLNIRQQMGGNTVAIDRALRAALASPDLHVPAGVQIHTWYDQSQLITAAAGSVRDAILIGAVLAALVLLAFLRNLRLTFIVAITLPAVLLASVLMLYFFHMSFNIMTLGGMAAAVGLIIDDAVVMLEHLMHRFSEAGRPLPILPTALELARPLAGSSAATIVIFTPLAFLSGVSGAFFQALAIAIASALVVSFLVAFIAVPLLAELLLRQRDAEAVEHEGRFQKSLGRWYRRGIGALLRRPLLLLPTVGTLLVLSLLAYSQVGSGFMPEMDEGGFVLDYTAPPGTSLAETDRLLNQVQDILARTPEVASYSRRTGLQLGGGLTEANTGDFFIRLKEHRQRDIWQIMASLRQEIHDRVPGLRVETGQLMEDLIGDLTAVPQPVEIKLFGSDPAVLERTAPRVAKAIARVPGVTEIFDGVTVVGDGVDIRIDPVRAAIQGMSPGQITGQLQVLMDGKIASRIPLPEETIGIRLRGPHALWQRIHDLGRLPILAPDGHYFQLRDVADIQVAPGQAELRSENLKPMVAVTARIEGRSLGSTMADVKGVVRGLSLPAGVQVVYGGLYAEQQRAMQQLALVLLAAILLVALLLLFLYERFSVVLAILATDLLALGATFIGLWLTGIERNLTAMIGMTMIVGIVTETAIFYFAELRNDRPEELIRAGQVRLRPVLMTALIAILALLPLALGIGAGAQMQAPLAVAIIAGLVFEIPLVLLVMPAMYALLTKAFGKRTSA
ncbi:efflux RND transporter permease subunit [Acidithiobacillus caldus]|uniref:efflux RND transporter permease subunit n=1 Tax=Acidithiobacillus caldus TaxID=33059 RepID=UPI001C078241|nr:efflux RND transporter permease subunit [Acidithiobacillus caldus]MBU2801944.1 efflux RND transporter permease subunit [Acidithiobacillus caldus]